MDIGPAERPCGIQLFGRRPRHDGPRAAERAMAFAPDVLDINMGCPMPKINASGRRRRADGGPSKMRAPLVSAVPPRGRCARHRQNPRGARQRPQKCAGGCRRVRRPRALAARPPCTRARKRRCISPARPIGRSSARSKEAVKIPVIGNGDVKSASDAANLLEQTGCDAVHGGAAPPSGTRGFSSRSTPRCATRWRFCRRRGFIRAIARTAAASAAHGRL